MVNPHGVKSRWIDFQTALSPSLSSIAPSSFSTALQLQSCKGPVNPCRPPYVNQHPVTPSWGFGFLIHRIYAGISDILGLSNMPSCLRNAHGRYAGKSISHKLYNSISRHNHGWYLEIWSLFIFSPFLRNGMSYFETDRLHCLVVNRERHYWQWPVSMASTLLTVRSPCLWLN